MVHLCVAFNFSCCLLLSYLCSEQEELLPAGCEHAEASVSAREEKCGVLTQDFQRLLRENRIKLSWNFSQIRIFRRLVIGQVMVASSEIPSNTVVLGIQEF